MDKDNAYRTLPESIVIPEIQGEMAVLRSATWADFDALDDLRAFSSSLTLIGKTDIATRAIARSWVQRSLRWEKGIHTQADASLDAEDRGVIAWSMFAKTYDSDHNSDYDSSQYSSDTSDSDKSDMQEELIGMAFLIDIDPWAAYARIYVILGENYRGRGYTRDVMPRVMTYGFAPAPTGLGLHRIWITASSSNPRAHAVYTSVGFSESGISRDALWDDSEGRYMDMHVYDILVDEFDPIRSLENFGLHPLKDNPGMSEAIAQHEKYRRHLSQILSVKTDDSNDDTQISVDKNNQRSSDSYHNIQHHNNSDQAFYHNSAENLSMTHDDNNDNHTEQKKFDTAEISESDKTNVPWWRRLGEGRKRI